MEASGVAQFAGGPEDRRLRLVLLGPLSDQRLFCGWELASRATAGFLLAIYVGYLPAGNFACKARDATSLAIVLSSETNSAALAETRVSGTAGTVNLALIGEKGCKRGAETCPVAPSLVFSELRITLLERMAGTTRLELVTSAMTAVTSTFNDIEEDGRHR